MSDIAIPGLPIIDSSLIVPLMVLHLIIGGIAATVAFRKGRNLGLWIVVGAIGGTPALIAALLLKED